MDKASGDASDEGKAHKHKKKIEWMIDHLEKGLKKGKIANKEDARRAVNFLEALHDQIGEPKHPSKDKKHKNKKSKSEKGDPAEGGP
jgi:hypothetical protein